MTVGGQANASALSELQVGVRCRCGVNAYPTYRVALHQAPTQDYALNSNHFTQNIDIARH